MQTNRVGVSLGELKPTTVQEFVFSKIDEFISFAALGHSAFLGQLLSTKIC